MNGEAQMLNFNLQFFSRTRNYIFNKQLNHTAQINSQTEIRALDTLPRGRRCRLPVSAGRRSESETAIWTWLSGPVTWTGIENGIWSGI